MFFYKGPMLKLFFHRDSYFVRGLNLLSLVLILAVLWHRGPGWVSGFLAFSWVFFNALNWIPWYPGTRGKLGIRLHFQKNLVPVVYLLPAAFLLKYLGAGEAALIPFALLLLPIYYVSIILLFFHFRDSSDLMPGYFSHNFYRQDEEESCTP